jgi:hypothetical protein
MLTLRFGDFANNLQESMCDIDSLSNNNSV